LEQQKKQTDNFYIDRIDNAVASEEFNKMQNMLDPINVVSCEILTCSIEANLTLRETPTTAMQ
jgi:hypothetical protein